MLQGILNEQCFLLEVRGKLVYFNDGQNARYRGIPRSNGSTGCRRGLRKVGWNIGCPLLHKQPTFRTYRNLKEFNTLLGKHEDWGELSVQACIGRLLAEVCGVFCDVVRTSDCHFSNQNASIFLASMTPLKSNWTSSKLKRASYTLQERLYEGFRIVPCLRKI